MKIEKYIINIKENRVVPNTEYKQYATNGSVFKIYIVKSKTTILYVGMTVQRISARFASSCRAYRVKSETGICVPGGDSGYKWIEKHNNKESDLDLTIFCFPEIDDRVFIEAVEAEIAFLIRKNTGSWPESQNEIHFHNDEKAKLVADKIYKEIK